MGKMVEKMGPLRGDGNALNANHGNSGEQCREDGSPSWGRKHGIIFFFVLNFFVEKMGPLRGDGNSAIWVFPVL